MTSNYEKSHTFQNLLESPTSCQWLIAKAIVIIADSGELRIQMHYSLTISHQQRSRTTGKKEKKRSAQYDKRPHFTLFVFSRISDSICGDQRFCICTEVQIHSLLCVLGDRPHRFAGEEITRLKHGVKQSI